MTQADDIINANKFKPNQIKTKESGVVQTQQLETLAATQHDIWAHWMKYLFDQCTLSSEGMAIPFGEVSRWVRQMNTSYAELSEGEKDSDRDQAKKIIVALKVDGFSIV